MQCGPKSKSLLICCDYDLTLTKIHFHSYLAHANVMPGQSLETFHHFLKNNLRNPQEIGQVFRKALNDGHRIAITSFTSYPELIWPTLRAMGLTQEEASKIFVVSGMSRSSTKKEHIEVAMKRFGITNKRQVVLVDDDENNTSAAKEDHCMVILVPKPNDKINNKEYIHKIDSIVNNARPILYFYTQSKQDIIENSMLKMLHILKSKNAEDHLVIKSKLPAGKHIPKDARIAIFSNGHKVQVFHESDGEMSLDFEMRFSDKEILQILALHFKHCIASGQAVKKLPSAVKYSLKTNDDRDGIYNEDVEMTEARISRKRKRTHQ